MWSTEAYRNLNPQWLDCNEIIMPEVVMDVGNYGPDMGADEQVVGQHGPTRPVQANKNLARYDNYVINKEDY